MSVLLREPHGFEGFGVAAKVAHTDDLAVTKREELCEFTADVQPGRPPGPGDLTEGEHRFAQVTNVVESNRDSRRP